MSNKTQWADHGNQFGPSPITTPSIPPGYYELSPMGTTLRPKPFNTDKLLVLDDSPTTGIIHNIRRFWKSKETFKLLGLLHKRGVLVEGPPGAGKSAMLELLCQEVVREGGIVLASNEYPGITLAAINMIRSVERDRPIIALMEDIDDMLEDSERDLLMMLDGENQAEDIVYLATTNHIEKIPDRIKNRPSRFDEVVHVGMPSESARKAYLTSKVGSLVSPELIAKWAANTEGFAIAHLRELIVGVVALQQDFDIVLARLNKMNTADLAVEKSAEAGANTANGTLGVASLNLKWN